MKLEPLPASKALDAYYLEARAQLLSLAAIFDRIDRGGKTDDPRLNRLCSALTILGDKHRHRAARVQELFSDHCELTTIP